MKKQNFEIKNAAIRDAFDALRESDPERLKQTLHFSWSNWGFGVEPLETTARRLRKAGIGYIELHGNRYGKDLGYRPAEALKILGDHGLRVSGVCGMFGVDNDLSSHRGIVRQAAIEYIRRQLDLAVEVKATYLLVVPGAVGRPEPVDDQEFFRSVESLRVVADSFRQANVRAAIEPIRSAEVSFCHTVDDALRYIAAVNHPAIQHVNGDVYHMLTEEAHIADTLYRNGRALTNLHIADTNRCALGDGSLDVDAIIQALYLIGYNNDSCFVTAEPLGPGGNPYPAMFGKTDPSQLDRLVNQTLCCWNERETAVRGGRP